MNSYYNETWFSNQEIKQDDRFGNWAIGLCEPGEINDCCYSYWLTGCAAAQAKSLMDGAFEVSIRCVSTS